MASIAHVMLELKVPPEFVRYDLETDATTIANLELWKEKTFQRLTELNRMIKQCALLSVAEQASVIVVAATFDGDDTFIASSSKVVAKECLEIVASKCYNRLLPAILQVLRVHIKPLFLSSSHQSVNLNTGRKLPRPAGGASASQDLYVDQIWKVDGLGCWNVLKWCAAHTEIEDFESIWPLFIPPLMTLLDDYDPPFKIRGIHILNEMLKPVDPKLLKRTGIDTLLFSSLSTTLSFLTSPETPVLLPVAIPAYLNLVEVATQPSSQARFDKLCGLVTTAVIGAWTYATTNLETMEVVAEMLPLIITSLGMGSARFLKAFIPQLSQDLIIKEYVPHSQRLQTLSARALTVIVRECKPKIPSWRGTIMDAALRCWVGLHDVDDGKAGSPLLREALLELFSALKGACPIEETEKDLRRLVALDSELFQPLLV